MTVASDTARVSYAGDGASTVFAVPFYFLDADDLVVIRRSAGGAEAVWARGTQYTVSGAGDPGGGSILVETSPTDYTPASGESLVILRALPLTQETDFTEGDPLPAATLERNLDKLTMIAQQQAEAMGRALKFSDGSPSVGIAMPEPEASMLVAWNEAATALENVAAADIEAAAVSAFARTLLDDADAAAARATLGALPDVLTARGDFLYEGAGGSARLGLGTSGQALLSNGTDPYWGSVVAGASATDLRLAFLLIAEMAGDRVNMVDGIADPFTDETDVDTATSINETHSSGSDYYYGQSVSTEDGATGTSGTLSGGYTRIDRRFAVDNSSRIIGLRVYLSTSHTVNVKLLQRTSANNYTVVASEDLSHTGSGWETVTLSSPYDVPASGDYYVGLHHSGGITSQRNTAGDSARYNGNIATSQSGVTELTSAGTVFPCGVQYGNVVNLTLVSNAFTADSAPATGRIHVQVKENESITINTDLTAEISRDGGTTWSTAMLALVETLADGTRAYEDVGVDISGQPSGTSMKYRIKTLNTKDIEVHGVILQWD